MKRYRFNGRFGKKAFLRKRIKKYLFLIIMAGIILISSWIVNNNIKPLLLAMAEVRSRVIATQAINEAVSSELTYRINYEDLFIIRTNQDNRVTMLQANTMVMNRLATQTALSIQEHLRQLGTKTVGIPLGSIMGSEIFANFGPRLNLEILPVGTVTVDFFSDFEQAGINQTRHKIYLTVDAQVRVILPLVSKSVNVLTRVPIAETIIVGEIPENYIFVPEDQFLNVVPDSAGD